MKIYVNKIENRIKFNIKTGYCLELSAPKTIKLLRSTKSKIDKDDRGENLASLKNQRSSISTL